MALPKKKSRSISIDGEIYQYSISRSKTSEDGKFNLTLTAKNKKSNGACLIAKGLQTRDFWLDFGDKPSHAKSEYKEITPKAVAKVIRKGINLGWKSKEEQGVFEIEISENLLEIQPKLNFAIIPVMELEPSTYSKQSYESPSGSIIELPEKWEEYNQKCYQDAALQNLKPIETGYWLFEIEHLTTENLNIIFPEVFSEYLNDEKERNELFEDMTDLAPPICGGFVLKDSEQILHIPACCCGLETVEEWRMQSNGSKVHVWTGHDQENEISLEFKSSEVILWIGESKQYTFSNAEYSFLLNQAESIIHQFIKRSGKVLDKLFNFKNGKELAEAMIYR